MKNTTKNHENSKEKKESVWCAFVINIKKTKRKMK